MATKTTTHRIEFNVSSGVSPVSWNRKNMGVANEANLTKAVEVMSEAWGVEFTHARLVRQACGTTVATVGA